VFPVRYEPDFYISLRRNSVSKGLILEWRGRGIEMAIRPIKCNGWERYGGKGGEEIKVRKEIQNKLSPVSFQGIIFNTFKIM
jgi:hypothetical protein